jgi:hypothetical protein
MTMQSTALRWLLLLFLGCTQHESAHPDAATGAGSGFACGSASCNEHTQYCYTFSGGVAPPYGCNALPAACGGTGTCACVTATLSPSDCLSGPLSCSEAGGEVHVTCTGP